MADNYQEISVKLNSAEGTVSVDGTRLGFRFYTVPSSVNVATAGFITIEEAKNGKATADLIKQAKNSIRSQQNSIEALNKSIAEDQAILNDPNSTSIQKKGAERRIAEQQQELARNQQELTGAQSVLSYAESGKFQTDLDKLVPVAEAEQKRLDDAANAAQNATQPTGQQTQPVAPAADNKPKNNLTGSADGDNNTGNNPSKNQPNLPPSSPGGTQPSVPSAAGPPSPTSGGQAATSGSQASAPSSQQQEPPGKRTQNPLANYPTYTYNLSLFMVTPTAYDQYVKSGLTTVNFADPGVALIAQSGGIDGATQNRGTGFKLDYYIDNLKINTATCAKDTDASTNTTEISFNIIEPYGFSFISNLKRTADDLIAKSKAAGIQNLGNPTRQFFMLGIRFTGFDNNGKPISTKDSALYERYYDIIITKIAFKLESRATVYTCTASCLAPGTAFGVKRGVVDTSVKLTGATVYEMLQDLMKQLNAQSAKLVQGKDIKPNTYKIKFMGAGVGDSVQDQRGAPIFNAKMMTVSDVNKSKLTGSKPKTTDQANVTKENKSAPDEKFNELTIAKGTPILQAFDIIITRSGYIEDAFKVLQTNALEDNKKNPNKDTSKVTDGQGIVQWYNVSAECTNAQYNKDLADFTWDITYVFRTYQTPLVSNPYSNLGVKYYGPHKRYDYWFTGQNSEILSYSQTLDNTYFNVALVPNKEESNPDSTSTPSTPSTPGKQPNVQRTDTQNAQGTAKNTYIASLFDPSAYANATIKIMGDPDFLMRESTSTVQTVYNQFYGSDGYTVNPNGGQVFIEIDFKEAQDYGFKSDDGVSYNPTGDGLLSINNKIQFWAYPVEIAEIVKGVSYQVLTVQSSFNQGKFEQDLQLIINTFPGYKPDVNRLEEVAVTGRRVPQSPAESTSTQVPQQTGLKTDPAPPVAGNTSNPPMSQTTTNAGLQPTTKTKTGLVADDDGLLTVSNKDILSGYTPTNVEEKPRDTGPVFDGTNWYDAEGNNLGPIRG